MKLSRKIAHFLMVFSTLLLARLSATEANLEIYTGDKVTPLESIMGQWAATHYDSYPYYYAAPESNVDCPPTGMYSLENEAFVMLANDEEKSIGILTAIAMDSPFLNGSYFPEDTAAKMKEKGVDPKDVMYIGMFLLDPKYSHDEALAFSMYDKLADLSKGLGKSKICYIDMSLPEDHPLRPAVFTSPEPWGEIINGFTTMDLTVDLSWPTFQTDGSVKNQTHTLLFYIKDL